MAKAAVEFREANEADLNDLIDLVLEDEPPSSRAALRATDVQCDRLARYQAEELVWIVGEEKGDIIAQAVFRWPHQHDRSGRPKPVGGAEVEDLRVHPAHRQRGLGGELLENLEWRCLREDVEELVVTADPDLEQAGIAWLERRGYVRSGEVYDASDVATEKQTPTRTREGDDAMRRRRVDMVKDLLAGGYNDAQAGSITE